MSPRHCTTRRSSARRWRSHAASGTTRMSRWTPLLCTTTCPVCRICRWVSGCPPITSRRPNLPALRCHPMPSVYPWDSRSTTTSCCRHELNPRVSCHSPHSESELFDPRYVHDPRDSWTLAKWRSYRTSDLTVPLGNCAGDWKNCDSLVIGWYRECWGLARLDRRKSIKLEGILVIGLESLSFYLIYITWHWCFY